MAWKRLLALILPVLIVLPLPPTRAQSGIPPAFPDVPYVPDGDSTKQVLDIYLPEGAEGPFPTLFLIHELGGSKWGFADQVEYLIGQGHAVVAIEYRDVSSRSPLGPVEDSFCALAWVHANAGDYRIDPEHIVVFGYSLGGYAAAMLGTVDAPSLFMANCPHELPDEDWAQGVVIYGGAFFGPPARIFPLMSDASESESEGFLDALAGIPPQEWRDSEALSDKARAFAQLLPLYWVDGSEPAFLLFHGERDTKVSVDESIEFATALEAAGNKVELVLIEGAGHGIRLYFNPPTPEVDEAMDAFLAALFAEDVEG